MARKAASDSKTSQQEVIARALEVVNPPSHEPLIDGAQDYWPEIIATRANADWPDEDRSLAAKLANQMALHRRACKTLASEGDTIEVNGTIKAHPVVTVMKTYMSDITAMRRDLQMHGRGKNGEARDVGKRRGQRRAVERDAQSKVAGKKDLLA